MKAKRTMSRFLCDKPKVEGFAQTCYADHGIAYRSDDERDSGTESDDEGAEIEELQKYMETIIHLDSGRRHQAHHRKRPPPLHQVTTTTPFQPTRHHHRRTRTTPRWSPGPPDSALPSDSDPHHSSEEELEVINCHHHKRKWAGSLDEDDSEEDKQDGFLSRSVEDRCLRNSVDEDRYLGRSVDEDRCFRYSEDRYTKSSVEDDRYSRRSVDEDRYFRTSVVDQNKDVVLMLKEELSGPQKDVLKSSVVDEDRYLRMDENSKDVVLLLKKEELNGHHKTRNGNNNEDGKDVVLIQKRKWGGSVDEDSGDAGEDVVLMLQDCPVEFRTSPPAHAHRPKWTIPPHELCLGSVVSPRKRCRRMTTTQRPCLDFEKMQQINRVRLL